MKTILKIALSCVLMVASTSSNADIIRMYEPDGRETGVELSRQTKLSRSYNGHVGIVNYDDINRVNSANLNSVGANATKIELLTPETVRVEVDMPQSVPVFQQNGFSQKFTGRIFMNKYADVEVVTGRLIVTCERSRGRYEELENTVFRGESSNIVVTKRALEDVLDMYYLDYTLGGDNGSEAVFSIELRSGSTSCIIRNLTSANSFDDLIPVYVSHSDFVIKGKSSAAMLSKVLDVPSTASVSSIDCEFDCNPYVVKHGASLELKITSLRVNGRLIPARIWADYVTCPPELRIREGAVPAAHFEFNIGLLDKDAVSTVVAEIAYSQIKLENGAPEWLDNFCKTSEGDTFSVKMTYIPTKDLLTPKSVTFPDCEETEGSVEALFDGDSSTFCHSSWTRSNYRSEPYASYLDVEFDEPVSQIGFLMQVRAYGVFSYPKTIHLYTSNDGKSWNKLGEAEIGKQYEQGDMIVEYLNPELWFEAEKPFKYLRWCVMKNSRRQSLILSDCSRFWNLAELRFYGK